MRRLAALAALILAPFAAPAALAGEITGAFDEQDGGPLAAVEVVALRVADSTLVAHASTGADGTFRLAGLAPGRYRVRATLLGHLPWTRDDVELTEARPSLALGRQVLAVAPLALPGITTTSERATAIVQADRNVYLTKDLPSASAGRATDVLRAIPDLDVDPEGHVSLRGNPSLTIQFNGRRSPVTGEALTNYLKQFPADRIERVEVITNPSAKFDPEGGGGIVNIVLKENVDLGLSGSVYTGAGTRSDNAGTQVAWQKGPLTLYGGLSGYWNAGHGAYGQSRLNRLADPPTHYESQAVADYPSGYGMSDLSADWALTKRATLYGTLEGWLSRYRNDGLTQVGLFDAAWNPIQRYDRDGRSTTDGRNGSATAGFRHVVEQSRDEWTLEYRQTGTHNGSASRSLERVFVPADSAGTNSVQDGVTGYAERGLQADGTFPLGKPGKLEVGYDGTDRRNTSATTLVFLLPGGAPAAFPPADTSDWRYREVFHSGYVTASRTIGRASLQLGARAEAARTTLDVASDGRSFRRYYRSLFPSANAAWDFGAGRTLRFSYSKRIERPSAWYLNPHVPTADTLSRYVGNPELGPKYTHAFEVTATWAGSRGMLQLAPFHRRTVDNWERWVRVDAAGAAITTWVNASAVTSTGASLTASLRQTGKLGGTLGLTAYREVHAAGAVPGTPRTVATNGSLRANLTYKAAAPLSLSGMVRVNPPQTLAQGRVDASVFSYLGAGWKLAENASLNLWASDPFGIYRWRYTSHDATYDQVSSNAYAMRAWTASLSWSWGKPPEDKVRRRQANEQPQSGPGTTGP